jgi:hypothetical protein
MIEPLSFNDVVPLRDLLLAGYAHNEICLKIQTSSYLEAAPLV